MKILVLGSRGFPNVQGGVEACCENLYPSIAAHGHEVIVISRSCYTGKKEYVYKGIRIIPFWAPKNMKLEALVHTFLGTLAALQFKPDIIHYHAIGPSFFVPLAKFFGFRVVATHHGFDYDRAKWGIFAKKFLQWSERHLCRAHAVISVARYIQESLQKRFHTNSIVIVNGALKKNILPFGEYCKRWNLEKKKYFLFTGRLVPEKGIHLLFDAFETMNTDWKLVIAGEADHETPYSKEIKKRAKTMPNVILTGYIKGEELQEIYSNAGAAVLPSSHEGLPLVLLEALNYGLPCIVSDIPAHREIEFETVNFFPLNHVKQLKNLMLEASEGKMINYSMSGRDYVEKNFNWEVQADKLLNVYEQLK